MARHHLLFLIIGLGLGACGPKAEAPTLSLPPTADTLMLTSGALTNGAWLHDQLWAVLGPDDATVWLVDFATGSISTVGQPGTSYRNPFGIFSFRDTLYVNDWGMSRMTVWSSAGELIEAIPASSTTRGTLPRARDDRGNTYMALRPNPGRDGAGNRDSTAVVKTTSAFEDPDTVAMLAPFDIEEVIGDAGPRFERKIFSGEDAWGALPNGSIWIARVRHNRVWWLHPDGTETRGPMLPDPVFPVTRLDKEVFLQRFPEGLRRTPERLPFADIKPPFVTGLTGPDGKIWLQKSRELQDSVQMYQRIGPEGELEAMIRVPIPAAILAVGRNHVLVAEPLDDGARLWQFENIMVMPDQSSPEISITTLPK
jgi:hypothetical protein